MALTPDDVVTKQFQHVRFKEGFDPDEVDDFLDEIVVEWRKTIAENDELKAKLAAYESGAEAPAAAPAAVVEEAPAPVAGRAGRRRGQGARRPPPRAPASSSSPSACTTSTSQRASRSATSSSPTPSPRPRPSSPKPRRRAAKRSPASTGAREPREPHHRAAQLRARLPRAAAQLHRGQAARPRDHGARRRVRPRCRPSASRPAFDRPSPPA